MKRKRKSYVRSSKPYKNEGSIRKIKNTDLPIKESVDVLDPTYVPIKESVDILATVFLNDSWPLILQQVMCIKPVPGSSLF